MTTFHEPGGVYTPAFVARAMICGSLAACRDGHEPAAAPHGLHILDPACGDGAFLLELFDALCPAGSDWTTRLEVVRRQLFGVDIDRAAVDAVRARLLARVAPEPAAARAAREVIAANVVWGDALTGADFSRPAARVPLPHAVNAQDAPGSPNAAKAEAPPVNWRRAFPLAAAAGGFGLVIGNPPYRRERNAKAVFDAVAATPLGKAWREARMDYWFYFLHRGLDVLAAGGVLSFIVNSYWIASSGARRLVARLQAEADFEQIVALGSAPVFPGVAGRHMIFRVRKKLPAAAAPRGPALPTTAKEQPPARKRGLTQIAELHAGSDLHAALAEATRPGAYTHPDAPGWMTYDLVPADLFQHGRIVVAPPDRWQLALENRRTLGELYDTRQGMAENPPLINRRLAAESGGAYHLGEGVFVLTDVELARLAFDEAERALLRPWFPASSIGRYRAPPQSTHQVLYLTRGTAPSLSGYPRVRAHLTRFRSILERRREVVSGRIDWWHLHWPRDEQIFLKPRVLSVQMGPQPQFVVATSATFVGFSINLVLERQPGAAFDLPTLSGILNSAIAAHWFNRHAKHRGVKLDINAAVLRQFPLPERCGKLETRLVELVRQRQAAETAGGARAEAGPLDAAIDAVVGELYGVAGPRP